MDTETNSLGSLDPQPGDHFGMVGFFPPLVRRLRAQNINLTVIELKEALVQHLAQVLLSSPVLSRLRGAARQRALSISPDAQP